MLTAPVELTYSLYQGGRHFFMSSISGLCEASIS